MIRVYVVFVKWRCEKDWREPLVSHYDFQTQAEVNAFKLGLAAALTDSVTSMSVRWASAQCCETESEMALYVKGFKEGAK